MPFRLLPAERFVIPLSQSGYFFDGEDPKVGAYPGLAAGTRLAEQRWNENKQSEALLTEETDAPSSPPTTNKPVPPTTSPPEPQTVTNCRTASAGCSTAALVLYSAAGPPTGTGLTRPRIRPPNGSAGSTSTSAAAKGLDYGIDP